ncbi:hypothetical protein [Vibrio alfacsensis]|uniref:hypothetical protein n=1 Tax=Vibrio alfacsensis TaxID=1074311 RepID=UPI0040696A92
MRLFKIGSLLAVGVMLASNNTYARDQISIVGSSTVYPFATVVAERFRKSTDFAVPKIESTGSGDHSRHVITQACDLGWHQNASK